MVKLTVAKYYTPSGRCIQKLDYSGKKAHQQASQIADSVIQKFKTKNGREVMDARGVEPDVEVTAKEYSKLAAILTAEDLIYFYANEYARKHASIASAREFRLNDAEYNDFLTAAKAKDFKYKTTTELRFEEFKKSAVRENYFNGAESEFDNMYKKIKADKTTDLERFKPEIKELIENEVVARYYYQDGRMENSFNYDNFLTEAIKVLQDEARYKGILDGSVKKVKENK